MKPNIEESIVKNQSLRIDQGKVTFRLSNLIIISARHVTDETRLEETSCNVHARLGNKGMELSAELL